MLLYRYITSTKIKLRQIGCLLKNGLRGNTCWCHDTSKIKAFLTTTEFMRTSRTESTICKKHEGKYKLLELRIGTRVVHVHAIYVYIYEYIYIYILCIYIYLFMLYEYI